MGLETLKSHRDKVKLRWKYKLTSTPVRSKEAARMEGEAIYRNTEEGLDYVCR